MTATETAIQLESLYCVQPYHSVPHWSGFGLAARVLPARQQAWFWQPDGIMQLLDTSKCDIRIMSASAAMCKKYLTAYEWRDWYVGVTYWLPTDFRQYSKGRVQIRVPYSLAVYLGAVDKACQHYKAVAELGARAVVAGWTTSQLFGPDDEVLFARRRKLPVFLNIRKRKYYNGLISHPK
jgi:hypothetical protein